MGTVIALAAGLVIWVVGYSFGVKSFDVFMITILILVIAAAVRIVAPSARQRLGQDP